MLPWARCCFCFCCRRSCSRADGPGCIMELDQMDWDGGEGGRRHSRLTLHALGFCKCCGLAQV